MAKRNAHGWLVVVAMTAIALGACTPPDPPPTQVAVTTHFTLCGGVVPPPGEPFCHTNPISAAVRLTQHRVVVASGTTASDGTLVVAVPAGTYVVQRVDAPSYEICDAPSVTAVAGATTSVVQNCTLNAP